MISLRNWNKKDKILLGGAIVILILAVSTTTTTMAKKHHQEQPTISTTVPSTSGYPTGSLQDLLQWIRTLGAEEVNKNMNVTILAAGPKNITVSYDDTVGNVQGLDVFETELNQTNFEGSVLATGSGENWGLHRIDNGTVTIDTFFPCPPTPTISPQSPLSSLSKLSNEKPCPGHVTG
jgi:hypothetical protein